MSIIKRIFLFGIVLSFFPTCPAVIYGQWNKPKTHLDSTIVLNWKAKKILKKYPLNGPMFLDYIKETYPHGLDSMLVWGNKELKNEKWNLASKIFDTILFSYHDQIEAHYGRGIGRRENGRYSHMMNRHWSWRDAKKHFEQVIAIDSTYRDVFYQYAVFERYQKHYIKAIELAHRQLNMNDQLDYVQKSLMRYYDSMLYHTDYDEAFTWLKNRCTPYDLYFLGELNRRAGHFHTADSLFQTVLENPDRFSLPPVYLSRVRGHVQREEFEQAEKTYWQALDVVEDELDKDLFLSDFMYIVNAKEYRLLKQTISKEDLKQAMQLFWLRRNPLPSMPFNQRLINHYRRILVAEEQFHYDGFRHLLYKSDFLNELKVPEWYYENHKLNDLGMIYIRFGEPNEKVSAIRQRRTVGMATDVERGTDLLPVTETIPPNISWLYHEKTTNPRMIFHFFLPEDSPPGYWTLIPGFDYPEILLELSQWDHRYHGMLNSETTGRLGSFKYALNKERAKDVDHALKNDRLSPPKENEVLALYHGMDQFRESDEIDVFHLSYAIPIQNLLDNDVKTDSVLLEVGFKILDRQAKIQDHQIRNIWINETSMGQIADDLFIDEFIFPLEHKPHNVTLHVRTPQNKKLNGWRWAQPAALGVRDKLAISTLKLAFNVTPKSDLELRHRDELNILPNPTKRFYKKDPVFVYYEIYNLLLDGKGQSDYSVNFSLKELDKSSFVKKITGIFSSGEEYKISVQSNQVGLNRTMSDYISFDMEKAKAGSYNLILEVIDNVSGEKARSQTLLELK